MLIAAESPNETDPWDESAYASLQKVEPELQADYLANKEKYEWLMCRTQYGDVDGVSDLREVPGYPPARWLVSTAMDEA